ncbi:hypothetical protein HDV57DRAFT_524025 [Trichoderma longibrachiatum]
MAPKHLVMEHPIVIRDEPENLTPEQLEEARDKFRALHTNYEQEDALVANLPMEDQLLHYQHLVKAVFTLAGVNADDYPQCFAACVAKCVETRVLYIRTWSSWGGYREFAELANNAAEYTLETHKVHLPYAPFLVAAMAVRKLRKFEPRPEDQLAPLVISFRMFEHLQGVIKAWTPVIPVIMHTTLDYENVNGQARFDNPQRLAQTAGVVISIDEDDATTNMAGLTVECQEFDQPFVKPRPKDTVMVAVHIKRSLTRDEVALDVDPTMDKLSVEYDKDEAAELLDRLTEHMLAVMPLSRKLQLREWAEVEGKKDVVEWIESKLVPEKWSERSEMVLAYVTTEDMLDIAKAKDMEDAEEAMRKMAVSAKEIADTIKREIEDAIKQKIGRLFQ